jgi:pimeloyl-ACP methyl ester carboxylesterase
VLLVHGFGGNKNNNSTLARELAAEGYVATSYSVRGQGGSGGRFDFFTSDRILEDLRSMIAFTKGLPDVHAGRVGVMGASQGGLHAWNAAAYGMDVRAVVSVIANGRARENWLEANALNWTFAAASLSPNVRFDSAVLDSITRARESGDFSYLRGYLEDASTRSLEQSVTTPTAIFVSYYDGFFDQNAALRQFRNIAGPKRIMLYPAGHSQPSVREQREEFDDVIARWLAYWLKDDASVASVVSPDSAVVFYDAGSGERLVFAADAPEQWLDAGSVLPENMIPLRLYFTGDGLRTEAQTTPCRRNINYINLLGSQPQVFRTRAPLTPGRPARIAARPGYLQVRGGGTGAQIQFNLLLYDVDTVANRRVPITRTHVQLPGTADTTVRVELNSAAHTIATGHLIEAHIDAGMALLPSQENNFGNYVVGPVDNSTTHIACGGNAPWSHITLYLYTDGPVQASIPPVAHDSRITTHWPQPARSSVMIEYSLAQADACRLSVYDSRGREVAVLHTGQREAGTHHARFTTGDLPAGLYLAVLRTGGVTDRRKILLMK